MTEQKYVDAIVKKVIATDARKKDIREQLLCDIRARMERGDAAEEIFAQMGTVQEVADGFNESVTPVERKRYFCRKRFKIAIPIVLAAAALIYLVYWQIPKGRAIEDSKTFTKEQVESAMIETVTLFEQEDYAAMQKNATAQMQSVLNKSSMDEVKKLFHESWGERTQVGVFYIQEVVQKNMHMAVGQVTVTYENTVVTYTLMYEEDMRLCGFYVK